MINTEICINCDSLQNMKSDVSAAFTGGASTIELCAEMKYDGLTPQTEMIITAREIFQRDGVMVMIRPRKGDFSYSKSELLEMKQQIQFAAKAGADGVVFGVLNLKNQTLAVDSLSELIQLSKSLNLKTTFHRAFDATPDPFQTLKKLIELGFDRILTSGTIWDSNKKAIDGIDTLNKLITQAAGTIEIVIGGGITPENAPEILKNLTNDYRKLSFHSFSGVQEKGIVTEKRVQLLVNSVNF